MEQLTVAQVGGQLEMIVDDIEEVELLRRGEGGERDGGGEAGDDKDDRRRRDDGATAHLLVRASARGAMDVTRVVLATGNKTDCMSVPLCRKLAEQFGLPVERGLPALARDLRWGDEQIYVVGALAMLQLGPDAANLMGARRGSWYSTHPLPCSRKSTDEDELRYAVSASGGRRGGGRAGGRAARRAARVGGSRAAAGGGGCGCPSSAAIRVR
eukprot:1181695-Prorocentrum_minimum.AAC.5